MTDDSQKFNAYIDGFNFYYGALADRPSLKWVDVRRLAQSLWPQSELGEVYYFTAQIKSKSANDDAPNRQNRYLRVLEEAGVNVVLGHFRKDKKYQNFASRELTEITRPILNNSNGAAEFVVSELFQDAAPELPSAHVQKFEEKGSDVNLAAYLLRDVFKNRVKHALVVTADADLARALEFARDEGAFISLAYPTSANNVRRLDENADYIQHIRPSTILESQFPDIVTASNGKNLYRPRTWS